MKNLKPTTNQLNKNNQPKPEKSYEDRLWEAQKKEREMERLQMESGDYEERGPSMLSLL